MRVLSGVVYMTKSKGPRTEPWGTPQEEICSEEKSLSHLTRKERDVRKDLNQFKTEPWIPNQDERRVIRMLWSMVSKAAERSRRQRQDNLGSNAHADHKQPTILVLCSWGPICPQDFSSGSFSASSICILFLYQYRLPSIIVKFVCYIKTRTYVSDTHCRSL